MFSFIFDASKGETPQSIALKRAIAARIMGGGGNRSAQNVGEGVGNALNSIGLGIAANVMNRRANAAEQAGMAGADSLKDRFVDMMTGGQSFPPAPSPDGSVPMPDAPQTFGGTGGSAAPATSFSGSRQEFVNMLMPAAIEASKRTGIDPRIIVAQSAQETGWGRSAPGNNYFGIKSHGKGGGQTFGTHEYVNGKRVNIRDSFRQFDSPEASVAGYADFIQQNPRYRPFMAAKGLDAQLEALQASGYATDPNYARSVGSIARGIPMPNVQSTSFSPDDLPAQWIDTQRQAMASEPADPATWPQRQLELMAGQQGPAAPAAPGPLPLLDDYFDARWGGPPQTPNETVLPEIGVEGDMPPDASAMFNPQPMTGGAPMPMMPGQSPGPEPVQVAQADPGRLEMSGMVDRAPPPDFGLLLDALNNPFLPPEIKSFAAAQLEQHMQARDPRHQLDMDYRRAQLAKMQEDMERGELINAGSGRLYNRRTGEWITAPGAEGGNSELGLNPQYGVDAEGNPVLLQLGKDGRVVQSEMPEGVSLSREPIKMDAGTHFVLLDPITRQPVGTVPKENYQEAFDTASGSNDAKSAAEARANLPKVEDNATAILGMIESLSTDPYLDSMVGPVSGRLPNVSADAARVQSKMDQIGGQAFLQAFETLRGGGQISNVEGERATAALARLNTAQSPQDYRQALEELSAIVRASLSRARRSAGSGSGNNPPPGASGDGWQDMGGVRIRRKQ